MTYLYITYSERFSAAPAETYAYFGDTHPGVSVIPTHLVTY